MKRLISMILVMAIMLMVFPFTAFGQENTDIRHYLDQTLSDMVVQKQVKGAIVTVVRDGTVALCKGYGYADEEKGIGAHEDNTAFRIGSISKTFVAIAAQQLVERGQLDMDAPISTYLEADFPKFKYDITMHDLLTHSAGFEDMISGIVVDEISKAEPLELSIRKYMPNQVFVPGEVVSYSNYGIALAAYVVQCIANQNFDQYAEDNIFKPLEMTRTSFKLDYKDVVISKGYSPKGAEAAQPIINLYPEGSVVTTARDMSKYLHWLMDDSDLVLSAEGKGHLFEKQFTMAEELEGMGYTWRRQEHNGILYYDKKGINVNFHSRIAVYPEKKTGVFVSFNTPMDDKQLDALMNEATNLLLGSKRQYSAAYTGKQTADISGYYITTVSGFGNIEKLMNCLMPNRVFQITGNLSEGFFMDGAQLLSIGENYYSTPRGGFKYIEKDGKAFLASSLAGSYVRISWVERNSVQLFLILSFAVISSVMAIRGLLALCRRTANKGDRFFAGISILQFLLLVVMCISIIKGISTYNMLEAASLIKTCGILIAAASLSGVLYTAQLFRRKMHKSQVVLPAVWSISSVLFILWMLLVNIL